MSSSLLYRTSGLALLLGAVLGSIGNVLGSVLFPNNDLSQSSSVVWFAVMLLSFIGSLFLLLGLPAVCVRQAERAGWLGFIGFVLTIIGGFLFTSFSPTALLILPWLAQEAPKLAASSGPPSLFVFFLVASLLFAVGGILLGVATMRARILPRWAGLLILVGAVLNLVSFPLSGVISAIVGTAAFIIFAVGFGWIGFSLMSTGNVEAAPSASAPSEALS